MAWEYLKIYWIFLKHCNEEFAGFPETYIVRKILKNINAIYDNINLGEKKLN